MSFAHEILLISLAYLLAAIHASVPSTIHIGGLFAPFTSAGQRDSAQAEHLAAFVMAIDQINNKTDGIHDNILPETALSYVIDTSVSLKTATQGFLNIQNSFQGDGVVAFISALENEESMVIGHLSTSASVPGIMTAANSGVFNDHATYPFVARTIASESEQGVVVQNMLCGVVRKVVMFLSTYDEDIELAMEFGSAPACQLTVMGQLIIRADSTDFSYQIAEALALGGRYFVFFMPAYQSAALLEQGHAAGLFNEYTVILTPDRGSKDISSYFQSDSDVVLMLTGFFTLQYWPNYFMNRTEQAVAFAHQWRNQPSRAGDTVTGACDQTTDSEGNYLYQTTTTVGNSQSFSCTGLDFSSYDTLGLTIQPYTGLTYDATILLARALHQVLLDSGDTKHASTVISTLIDITNNGSLISGVTGPISFNPGQFALGYGGRGNRAVGVEYIMTNFNPTLFADYNLPVDQCFVPIGYFDADAGTFILCSPIDFVDCFPPVFAGMTDGSYYVPPPDAPYPIYMKIGAEFGIFFDLLSGIIIFLVIIFAVFTLVHRKSKTIKASQPSLLCCILVGGLLAAARISVGGKDKDDSVCNAEFWLGHLSFVMMIGSLFVKSYRVHCIVNTKSLRRYKFTTLDAFKVLMAILLATTVYLIVSTCVGQPTVRHVSVTKQNQETVWEYCTMVHPHFQTALFALECVLLLVGFRICWEIRNVPDIVNESKQISIAMSSIVLVSVLVMPIVYVLGLPVHVCELIASLGFGFGAIATLTLLFIPKVALVYTRSHQSAKIFAADLMNGLSTKGGKMSAKKAKGRNDRPNNDGENNANATGATAQGPGGASEAANLNYVFSHDFFKHKTRGDRLHIVEEQINGWQALLMKEQRFALRSDDSHSDQSSSLAGSTSPVNLNRMMCQNEFASADADESCSPTLTACGQHSQLLLFERQGEGHGQEQDQEGGDVVGTTLQGVNNAGGGARREFSSAAEAEDASASIRLVHSNTNQEILFMRELNSANNTSEVEREGQLNSGFGASNGINNEMCVSALEVEEL